MTIVRFFLPLVFTVAIPFGWDRGPTGCLTAYPAVFEVNYGCDRISLLRDSETTGPGYIACCPGSINLRSFRSLKPNDFRKDLEINLIGAVKFLQACMAGIKKGAADQPTSVVLFSTVAVSQGLPMHASVAAAKGAIEGLTRSLASEWAPKIRVNCLAPALTETPLNLRNSIFR